MDTPILIGRQTKYVGRQTKLVIKGPRLAEEKSLNLRFYYN